LVGASLGQLLSSFESFVCPDVCSTFEFNAIFIDVLARIHRINLFYELGHLFCPSFTPYVGVDAIIVSIRTLKRVARTRLLRWFEDVLLRCLSSSVVTFAD
jgi:hypothetical protein